MATDVFYDIATGSSGYETDEGLMTAALLSLLTDARADAEDVVPDATDLRGWWGSDFAEEPGDVFGSKLWLTETGLATQETLEAAENYIREALQWMLDDGYVELITVKLEIQDRALAGQVILDRPQGLGQVAIDLWDATISGP